MPFVVAIFFLHSRAKPDPISRRQRNVGRFRTGVARWLPDQSEASWETAHRKCRTTAEWKVTFSFSSKFLKNLGIFSKIYCSQLLNCQYLTLRWPLRLQWPLENRNFHPVCLLSFEYFVFPSLKGLKNEHTWLKTKKWCFCSRVDSLQEAVMEISNTVFSMSETLAKNSVKRVRLLFLSLFLFLPIGL